MLYTSIFVIVFDHRQKAKIDDAPYFNNFKEISTPFGLVGYTAQEHNMIEDCNKMKVA